MLEQDIPILDTLPKIVPCITTHWGKLPIDDDNYPTWYLDYCVLHYIGPDGNQEQLKFQPSFDDDNGIRNQAKELLQKNN